MATLESAEIRRAFNCPIAPVTTSIGYKLRLLGVLVGLVLLQLSYLLLIAGVGCLTWLYLNLIMGLAPTFNALTIILYFGPPAAGIIAVLFLLKPLVIRPKQAPKPIRILPESDPVLFEFVEALCRVMGCPRPETISADLQVNASAGIHGWRGMILGHMNLTIGLPLATSLSLAEFTGVLAHEFGHFAQRAGLRSHYLIQLIQNWFFRVAHQRDALDAWLERMCRRRDWRIKGIAHLATAVVTGSRKYLGLLMQAARWTGSSFSRQMEFDADRYEAAVVGPEVFGQTLLRLAVLDLGATVAWQDATKEWSVGRLPDDMAALVTARVSCFPAETVAEVYRHGALQRTGRLDTHPSTEDRVSSVRQAGLTGVFVLEGAAERLFRDLPSLCQAATRHHYRSVFHLAPDSVKLVPIEQSVAGAEASREFDSAGLQFLGCPPEVASWWFRFPDEAQTAGSAAPVDVAGQKVPIDVETLEKAVHTNFLQFSAEFIVRAGVAIVPGGFELNSAELRSIQAQEATSFIRIGKLMAECREASRGAAAGIAATIARSRNDSLTISITERAKNWIPNLPTAADCYTAVSKYQDELLEIRRAAFAARIIRQNSRLFSAAACANILDRLEGSAAASIDRIACSTLEVPSSLVIDPDAGSSLGAQLKLEGVARTERISSFISRFDVIAGRALGHLSWFTIFALPAGETDRDANAIPPADTSRPASGTCLC